MAGFFIDRPIFAWVIALFVLVMGGVAITQLPVAQYPPVAPPSIVIGTAYPGASAQDAGRQRAVGHRARDERRAGADLHRIGGAGRRHRQHHAELRARTNPDLAQVDVQNRLGRATPRLPAAVTQQGVRVDKSRANFLLFTILSSSDPKIDPIALGDYASRNVLPELQRVPGVGQAQLFGTERAMRIWIDPAKLQGFALSAADVIKAISSQNAQVPRARSVTCRTSRGRASRPPSSSPASSAPSSSSATSSCAPTPTVRPCG